MSKFLGKKNKNDSSRNLNGSKTLKYIQLKPSNNSSFTMEKVIWSPNSHSTQN